MVKTTWSDVDGLIPDCTLGRLMDMVEEKTGKFPEWSDTIPDDIFNIIFGE